MSGKSSWSFKNIRLQWIGILIGIIYWFLESVLDAFIFHTGGIIERISTPDPNETWMRLLVISIFVIFSFYAQSLIDKRNKAEEEVRKLNEDLERRIIERTAQLEAANRKLQNEISDHRQVEEELKFRSILLDSARDSVFVLDQEGRVIYVNEAAYKDRGFTKEELIGKSIDEVDAPQYKELVRQRMAKLLETGSIRVETAHLKKDGTLMDVEVNARVIEFGGRKVVVGILRDIAERKKAEEALRFIAEGTAAVTGDDFFRSIAHHLALALNVRYALVIERMQSSPNRVRTLAVWTGKDFGENIEYYLKGTPCDGVEKGAICYYPDKVQEFFPKDKILAEMGVQSYLGIPLLNSSGIVVGHLAVLDDKAMDDEDRKKSTIKIFAARAGAEIERKLIEEKIKHMAYHDQLTNLPNRALFYDRLQQAILVSSRNNRPVALLYLDLDNFKEVNDTLGHHNGDHLLQQVGLRIQDMLRKSDTVARMGGDEFAVLLPGTNIDGAILTAQKILESLGVPYDVEGKAVRIGASIGIVLYPDHGKDFDLLIQQADKAMYTAKQSGKGYAIYISEMQ